MSTRLKGWLFFAVILAWLGAASPVHGFYNPSTGRWLSRDPIQETGGPNVYNFNGNGPIANIDRDGRTVYPDPPDPNQPPGNLPRSPSPPTPTDTNGGITGVPDILLNPKAVPFTCPTPLRNLRSFQIDIKACGRRCTRWRAKFSGQVGDCYDTNNSLLNQVITGMTSNSSAYWSPFCCCRNGAISVTMTFAGQQYQGNGIVDVNSWLQGTP